MIRSLLRSLRLLSASAALVLCGSELLAATPVAAPSLPLSFEQNQGQVAPQYSFLFRHDGTEALFRNDGVDLQFTKATSRVSPHLGLRLLGQSAGVSLRSELPLEGRTNYLLGADASRWVRNVPTFSRVRYTAVYPGVDLVFYGNTSRLEHDFRVAPGADPDRIAFRLDGANELTQSATGDLRVSLGDDLFVLQRPFAYQESDRGRTEVAAAFTIARDGTIAFKLGAYDHTRELVIDPALTYATYLDKLSVGVAGIATDSTGSTYVTGYVFQSTYETTPGAFQTTCPACTNTAPAAYITKIDPTGTKVVYSTFLGGQGYTQPFSIAVDAKGDAVIGGRTEAADYPIKNNVGSGAFNTGTSAGFVSSLTPDGSALNFSSVFAGESGSVVFSVAIDPSGNTFFAGNTNSSSYPVTPGALHAGTPSYNHLYGFVTKLTLTGSLTYSAIVGNEDPQNGGAGLIAIQGLAVDAQGNAYITGSAGTLWPTTPGAYQTTIPGDMPYDAPFVTKIAADGSHFIFSTFIGIGLGQAIALDASNNIDLLSSTSESTATYTSYLSQLSPDGSQLLHNTTLGSGSGPASYPASLAIDPHGNVWIAGSTADTSYPLLHPLQSFHPSSDYGSRNGFLSEFDATGTILKFSTFYGSGSAGINAVAIAPAGIVNIAGTTSDAIYTTPNSPIGSITPAPPNYMYNYGFLARIDPAQSSAALCVDNGLSRSPGLETPVGTPIPLSLQIKSCGERPLTLSSILSSSTLFTVQDPTAACGSALAPGAACTVPITFVPTHSGTVTTALTLLSNASIPTATVSLTATGTPLPPTFSNTSLTFNTTPGVASPTQTITVTNVSDIPLTFIQFNITEPFTGNNTCEEKLAPGSTCSILVGFSPATAGTFKGAIYLSESQSEYNQQIITLTGTAAEPSVTVGPATPAAATQTVTGGQAATYSLSTTSVGNFTGVATFSCTDLPLYAACHFAPSSVSLTAGTSTPVTLTITTQQTNAAALLRSRTNVGGLLILSALGAPLLWISRRRASAMGGAGLLMAGLRALAIGSSALLLGCGGGSHAGTPSNPTPASTPAGTYSIKVNAQTASSSVATPVTLIVR